MTWVLVRKKNKHVNSPYNRSRYARHKSTDMWIYGIRPRIDEYYEKREKQPQRDLYEGFTDMKKFASTVRFAWPRPLTIAIPVGQTWLERECVVPYPRDFREILGAVLGDIADVIANKNKPPENPDASWPLSKHAFLGIHLGNSESPDITPTRFRELEFYFYGGGGGKFYLWRMILEDGDAAGLSDLIIPEENPFDSLRQVSGSVWIARRTNGGELVLKYETCAQPFSQYKSRYDYISWLARRAFEGVPKSALLTHVELKTISRVTARDDGQPMTLAGVASYTLQNATNDYFVKMPVIAMGDNLQKRVEDLKNAEMTEQLRNFLFVSNKLRALGAIAVFDLIVNNNDRFAVYREGRQKWLGLNNIDFLATGQPVALDNVSPEAPWITADKWPGKDHLTTAQGQKGYARVVLNTFREITAAQHDDEEVALFENEFYKGMREGTKKLNTLKNELLARVDKDRDEYGKRIGTIIAQRIASTAD